MVQDPVVGPLEAVPGPPLLHVIVPHVARPLAARDALLLREAVPPRLRLREEQEKIKLLSIVLDIVHIESIDISNYEQSNFRYIEILNIDFFDISK